MGAANHHHFLVIQAGCVMPTKIKYRFKKRISEHSFLDNDCIFLTSATDSGNCVKSANGEFPDSNWASRLACAVICGDTRGGTFKLKLCFK